MSERTQADYPLTVISQHALRYCWEHPHYADDLLAPERLALYTACEPLLAAAPEAMLRLMGGRGQRLLDVFESIRDNGYWTNVPMIAHRLDRGLYAVVPGNERLCSLRALERSDPARWRAVLPDGMVPARIALLGDLVDDATPADLLFDRPGRE